MALCLPLFSLFLLLVARPLQGERRGATCQQAHSFSFHLCFLTHLSLSVSSRKRAGLTGCILLHPCRSSSGNDATGRGQRRAHHSLVSGGCDYRKRALPPFSSRPKSCFFQSYKLYFQRIERERPSCHQFLCFPLSPSCI